jgi:HYDIN/CFA65/VesB-like, Ig-like domain
MSGVAAAPTASIAGIAFGAKAAGSTTTKDATVTNTGTAPLTVSAVGISGSSALTATRGTCTAAIAPGKTCKLSVSFRPVAGTASYSATLTITSNASNTPTATLTGSRK